MKAKHSVWKNKLVKTMSLVTAILVAALFLGTAASAGIAHNSTPTEKTNNITAISQVDVVSIGRAPQTSTPNTIINRELGELLYEPFYAVNDGSDMFCSFVPSAPGTFTNIGTATPTGFIQNACFVLDVYWVIDQYGTLYNVDLTSGVFTTVGPTGVTDTMGLAYDDTTGQMFMTAGTYTNGNLYEVDMSTGAATLIGNMGNTGFAMISIVCDNDGQLYGAEIVAAGSPGMFYSIDKSTGAGTQIGPVGFSMNYGQDMEYDKDNDILYFCAFNYDTFAAEFRTIDKTTGMSTFVGNLPDQTTGFGIPYEPPIPYAHDIAIQSIVEPKTGNAGSITPIVKVKNSGANTETNVPVELEIGKELITGYVEDFEVTNGSYIHLAKLTDSWQWGVPTSGPGAAHSGSKLWATILNGAYPNNMWSSLVTPDIVVPSGAMFKFWNWYSFESGWDGGNVKISTDGGVTYTIITPEGGYPGTLSSNPYMTGQPGYTGQGGASWNQALFDLSDYEGMTVKIMFETASDSSVTYPGWYIDEVGFSIVSWVTEYTQTVVIPTIAPDEVVNLSFPTWTPSDLGLVENVNINYNAEATNLFVDENANNDNKEKFFNLHYGYFHDVAVTEIISPVSGLAETQTPEVVIENHGQNDESVNVQMTIGKALYTTLLEEDFAGGVPPAGWGTNNPDNWYSSSTNYAGGVAPEVIFNYYPSSVGEHLLWTGVIDTTGYTALGLSFKEYVNDYNGDYTLKIVTSTDGGATWGDAYVRAGGPYGPATTDVTLTAANGVGSATLQIAWDLSGDSFNINYWYIDDVWMGIIDMVDEYDQTVTIDVDAGASANAILPDWTPSDIPFSTAIDYLVNVEATLNGFSPIYSYGFEDWVPPVPPVPPTPLITWGFETWPDGWTQTDTGWVQYSYNPTGGTGFCAEIPYYSCASGEWFMSPAYDTSSQSALTLNFKHFIDWYGGGNTYFYVETRANSGDTWTDRTPWANPVGGNLGPATYNIDITSDIGTGTQVRFVFVGTAFNFDYWYIDDVIFGSGGAPGVPGYWPSFNQYYYGTASEQWLSVTSGVNPTCSPPEGIYMAEYNSYDVLSGNSAELDGTVLVDFTTATQMKFKMMHDTMYSASTDVIYPLLSADGVNYYLWSYTDGFYRYDGTTGWKEETYDYTNLINYFGGPGYYYIGFYAVSDYGNNMFIDDINVMVASEIPDGYPADNTLGAIITLSYEHDVGVVAITEYPGSAAGRDIVWDNYADDGTGTGLSSQLDIVYPFNSQCADDFQLAAAKDITGVHWWGAFWNGVSGAYPNPCEFNIIFYADDGSGTMPTGAGMDDPTSTALAVYNFPAVTGVSYGTDKFEYDVTLGTPFFADAGVKYWIAVQAVFQFTGNGQWGFSTNGANPEQLSGPVQGFPLLGTNYWTATIYGDHAFQLSGEDHQGPSEGNPPPGTYGIAGTIKNLGVTYSEIDIPVNAQVTNDTGVVVYDETIVVTGPIAPGGMVPVEFPDITIPDIPAAEGDYKLTMQTQLVGDDHPNNDKKTQTWIIQRPDITPPTTTVTLSGTMGQNNWYVSNVQVTLTATDGKWPMGVNHTYYKIDSGSYQEYTVPFAVETDGQHTVFFYSDDKAVPPNVEEEKSISFQMDKTAPEFINYSFTPLNFMKNKWLCVATVEDDTSGLDYVEFYVDDALVGSVDAPGPYEFEFDGKPTTSSQALAYDLAGNSALSEVATAMEFGYQQQMYPVKIL